MFFKAGKRRMPERLEQAFSLYTPEMLPTLILIATSVNVLAGLELP